MMRKTKVRNLFVDCGIPSGIRYTLRSLLGDRLKIMEPRPGLLAGIEFGQFSSWVHMAQEALDVELCQE